MEAPLSIQVKIDDIGKHIKSLLSTDGQAYNGSTGMEINLTSLLGKDSGLEKTRLELLGQWQCDQMARLLFQYLAFYDIENLQSIDVM